MSEQKPRLVVFCGAGFSRAANVPVMSEFGSRLRGGTYLSAEELADFDRIQAYCNTLSATIGESAQNIEQLASFLSILERSAPEHPIPGCRRFVHAADALTLVKRCLIVLVSGRSLQQANVCGTLLDLVRRFDLSLVTTNYDIVIELAAASRRFQKAKPVVGIGLTPRLRKGLMRDALSDKAFDRLYRDDGVPLFKLHGSVNWFQGSDGAVFVEDEVFPEAIQVSEERSPLSISLRGVGGLASLDRRKSIANPEPLVVPPTVLKPEVRMLEDQWQGAWEALHEAEYLCFIGYSFPESDSFMRFFLSSALTDNPRLRRIVIIDPAATDIEDRVASVFQMPSLARCLDFIPYEWHKGLPLDAIIRGVWEPDPKHSPLKERSQRIEAMRIHQGLSNSMMEEPPQINRLRRGVRGHLR